MSSGPTSIPLEQRGDVATTTDVETIVRRFYGDVAQDDLLGPVFNDIAQVDWADHIPKLVAFWCRFLFKQPGYEGDPHAQHMAIHLQRPFDSDLFWRWLDLFHQTLDAAWAGPNVERMKMLARSVARVHCRNLTGQEVDFGLPPEPLPILGQSPER